ncbi:MAG: FkbM family methyltransferase [Bacteroidetes bacterium]|nr:FkbM family methyltransferase [Bacteroidota bacterium]
MNLKIIDVFIGKFIEEFNHHPLWRRQIQVGPHCFKASSFDRLLYLELHRISLMGHQDKMVFQKYLKPGMNVVDAGANIGKYSVLFSEIVGPEGSVFAFEPEPITFKTLENNIEVNGITNVKAFKHALGSEPGKMTLSCSLIHSGDNRLRRSTNGNVFRKDIEVSVVTLDSILENHRVDFIKIDVQGWEFEVLEGARRILDTNINTVIYFEFAPRLLNETGHQPIILLKLLKSHNFRIFQINGEMETEIHNFERYMKTFSDNSFVSLIAHH